MAIYSTFFLCDRDKLSGMFPSWRAPLAEPVVRELKNPFTGALTRVSSREPDWPDEAVENFHGQDYRVVSIQGDYRDYLEGRLPPGVRAQPHWATKGLTAIELSPLAEAAGTEPALDVALYAPPSFAATLDEVNPDLVLALGAADDQTLDSIAARWAATMSSPSYTHSVTGEKLEDGWSTADALEILRPLVALIGRASAEQRLYLLTEA